MKVMIWNIERLGLTKVTTGMQGKPQYGQPVQDYLYGTIAAVDADVVLIFEVQTRRGNVGTLITGSGADGILLAAEHFRPRMQLVPPLRLNGTEPGQAAEGIGVLFKPDTVDFEGPDYFNGTRAVPDAPGQAYPPRWRRHYPGSRAGRVQFHLNRAKRLQEGKRYVEFPGETYRRPMQVNFRERTGAKRLFRIWGIHTTPHLTDQADAMLTMGEMFAFHDAVPQNTTDIVCGDFNINMLNQQKSAAFANLTAAPGFRAMTTYQSAPATDWYTHLRTRKAAYPALPLQNVPKTYVNRSCIDGFLVRGAGAPTVTVIDRVVGRGLGLGQYLPRTLDWYRDSDPGRSSWKGPNGFGGIRVGSDHLPVLLDVQ